MHLAKRAALAAAILVSVGVTACKKKDADKKADPAAKTDDQGSGSASGSGTAAATDKKPDALVAIKGAMAAASEEQAGAAGGMGLGGGMGIGAKLGGLFGGDKAAAAPPTDSTGAPVMGKHELEEKVAAGDMPPPPEEPEHTAATIKFPPPGQAGGDCAAVTDRLMLAIGAMMEAEMGELTAEQKAASAKELEAQMTGMREQLMTMCTEQSWPQELKDCALAAMSEEDLDACEKYVPEGMDDGDEPDDDLTAGEDYPAAPAQPVAAWTGGDDCKAVGERVVQLATAQMGSEMEGEYAAEMAKALEEAAAQLVTMCNDGQWPEDIRKCVLAAGTIDVAGECLEKVEM